MKKLILFVLLFAGITRLEASISPANADLDLIRGKVKAELMAQSVNESSVRALMATILPDGTWPGISYKDVSNTGFQHRVHLTNMVDMALAFEKKGSKLRGDTKLKKTIYSALNYWIANDFICDNWWWNQIGTPNQLISLLLIMDADLTKDQVAKILPMIGRANLSATGARPSGDRIKIAGILAKTLLYRRDVEQFNEVVKVIEGEIKFTTGRGMQYDYSFHHREDKVNNTISYGLGYADAFAEWASLVAGTKYKFSDPALHQLIDYYLDGICKMLIFGKSPDPGAKNRDITRFDGEKILGTAPLERLRTATDYRKKELEEIVKIRKGEPGVPSSVRSFFWQ
jgi:chondroitin AC lyase